MIFVLYRLRRWLISGCLVGAVTGLCTWYFALPEPRIDWEIDTQPEAFQTLIGYSPGKRWLINAGYRSVPGDQVVRIWDVHSGQSAPSQIISLASTKPPEAIWDAFELQISPDDKELLYHLSDKKSVSFFDPATGERLGKWNIPAWGQLHWDDQLAERVQPTGRMQQADQIRYSPEGTWLSLERRSLHNDSCAVIDRSTHEFHLVVPGADPRFSRDGQCLVVREFELEDASGRSTPYHKGWAIWNLETRRKQSFVAGTPEQRYPAQICHEAQILITDTGTSDNFDSQRGGVRLVQPSTGSFVKDLPNEMCAVLSKDESLFVTINHGAREFVIRDSFTGTERVHRSIRGRHSQIAATENSQIPFIACTSVISNRKGNQSEWHLDDRADWRFYDILRDQELGKLPRDVTQSGLNPHIGPDGNEVANIELVGSRKRHHLRIYELPTTKPRLRIFMTSAIAGALAILIVEAFFILQGRWRDPAGTLRD